MQVNLLRCWALFNPRVHSQLRWTWGCGNQLRSRSSFQLNVQAIGTVLATQTAHTFTHCCSVPPPCWQFLQGAVYCILRHSHC